MEERGQTQQGNDSSRFEYSGDDARAQRGDEVIGVRACDERYDAHDADAVNSSDDGGGADGVSLPLSLQRGDAVHHDDAFVVYFPRFKTKWNPVGFGEIRRAIPVQVVFRVDIASLRSL